MSLRCVDCLAAASVMSALGVSLGLLKLEAPDLLAVREKALGGVQSVVQRCSYEAFHRRGRGNSAVPTLRLLLTLSRKDHFAYLSSRLIEDSLDLLYLLVVKVRIVVEDRACDIADASAYSRQRAPPWLCDP